MYFYINVLYSRDLYFLNLFLRAVKLNINNIYKNLLKVIHNDKIKTNLNNYGFNNCSELTLFF